MTEREIQNWFYRRESNRFSTIIPNCCPVRWFECDILAITKAKYMYEYEIKLTINDFKADAKKVMKDWRSWSEERGWKPKHERLFTGDVNGPSRFWFMVPDGLIPISDVPEFAGLIYLTNYKDCVGFTEQKRAPRLHRTKMCERTLDQIRERLYYRYWNERLPNNEPRY